MKDIRRESWEASGRFFFKWLGIGWLVFVGLIVLAKVFGWYDGGSGE